MACLCCRLLELHVRASEASFRHKETKVLTRADVQERWRIITWCLLWSGRGCLTQECSPRRHLSVCSSRPRRGWRADLSFLHQTGCCSYKTPESEASRPSLTWLVGTLHTEALNVRRRSGWRVSIYSHSSRRRAQTWGRLSLTETRCWGGWGVKQKVIRMRKTSERSFRWRHHTFSHVKKSQSQSPFLHSEINLSHLEMTRVMISLLQFNFFISFSKIIIHSHPHEFRAQ